MAALNRNPERLGADRAETATEGATNSASPFLAERARVARSCPVARSDVSAGRRRGVRRDRFPLRHRALPLRRATGGGRARAAPGLFASSLPYLCDRRVDRVTEVHRRLAGPG